MTIAPHDRPRVDIVAHEFIDVGVGERSSSYFPAEDGGWLFDQLPAHICREVFVNAAMLDKVTLSEKAGNTLLSTRDPEFKTPGNALFSFKPKIRFEVRVCRSQLADRLIANGRLDELPDHHGQILEYASQDWIDRYHAEKGADIMLKIEPTLDSTPTSGLTP